MTSPAPLCGGISFSPDDRWGTLDAFPSVTDPYLAGVDRTLGSVSGNSPASCAQLKDDTLQFLPLDEWDVNNSYHEDVPSYLHYSIEWKITVNSRAISKDTEQDLVLAPSSYWHIVLKPKLEQLLERKLAPNRRVYCDDTDVKVSATGSRKRCLTRRFEKTIIDWPVVEKQLIDWG
jgi:hypothetical protein